MIQLLCCLSLLNQVLLLSPLAALKLAA